MPASRGQHLNIALIGPGNVGKAFLHQIASNTSFTLVATISTTQMQLGTRQSAADLPTFLTYLSALHPCVVVDCTASQSIALNYPSFLEQNLSIVTPNKKAFSGDIGLYQQIKSLSSSRWPLCYHESSVGAGLPLLSTIQDLVDTGDIIHSISGVFSGTLSYIFNSFCSPTNTLTFSQIVKDAQQNGYTEPDPRDDLNGLDVARKVAILARLTGDPISLSGIAVASLVPAELASASAEVFMANLHEFDTFFQTKLETARANGMVLRYVGVVEKDMYRVELNSYPNSHPFAGLQGSDNIIQLKTTRFPNSIVIQGAGDAVTAFGIYTDLLKIQRQL